MPWSFWLQLCGVVAIACAFFHDGAVTRPLWIAGSTSLLAAAAMFCAVVMRTLRAGGPAREPFMPWIAAGAWWLVIASALALTAATTGDVTWHRMLWTAALSGFISCWIFGVGRRILPIFLGCQPRWPHIETGVFILYQIGTAAWVLGAWQGTDSLVLIGRAHGRCGSDDCVSCRLHGVPRSIHINRSAARMRDPKPAERLGEIRVRRVGLAGRRV